MAVEHERLVMCMIHEPRAGELVLMAQLFGEMSVGGVGGRRHPRRRRLLLDQVLRTAAELNSQKKKKTPTELWSTVPTCSGRDFPFVFVRFSFSPHLAARLSPYKSQPGIAINCIVLLSKENRIVSQPMRVHCFYFRPKSLSFVLFLSLNRRFLKATAVSCRAQFVTSSFE